MNPTAVWGLIRETFSDWSEDRAPRLAAALAYYTVFALAPLLIIVIAIAGLFFGETQVRESILGQVGGLIGQNGREAIDAMIQGARKPAAGVIATVIGVITLIFAAGGLFGQLQDALNTIWEVQPKPGLGIVQMIIDRFFAFAMVLVIWFLMLISFVTSALMASAVRVASAYVVGIQFMESAFSLALITLLFALIYRILPDVRVAWRDVWLGAFVTAGLFVIGKSLFGLYLGHSSLGSSYGAAGSLVIVILWVYYSCLILLFGAEMTQVQARLHHAPLEPTAKAVHVTEHARVQQGIPRTADVEEAVRAEKE